MFNSTDNIVCGPQAFATFLMEQGYAPERARAIASKGFGASNNGAEEPMVADLVKQMADRRRTLEAKSGTRIDVYEGQTVQQERFYSIKHEWVTVSIRPQDRDVSFDARVYYHFWAENGPVARDELLYGDAGRGRFEARLRVRDNDASWAEILLGGRHGNLLKRLRVEIQAHQGSTSYDVKFR